MSKSKIELNNYYNDRLGWTPDMWMSAQVDATFIANVQAWQSSRPPLVADGVCGPRTYGAWLDEHFQARRAKVFDQGEDVDTRLNHAGELALNRALRRWLDDVQDPPTASPVYDRSRSFIDSIIRQYPGLGWEWQSDYTKDKEFGWCGAFVAYAWGAVGLRKEQMRRDSASNYRLAMAAQYKQAFEDQAPPVPPQSLLERRRYVDPNGDLMELLEFGPRAGDIVLVSGKPAYGTHIALLERYDVKTNRYFTVEGNGTGTGLTKNNVHGVVRRIRDGDTIKRLVRWSVHDLLDANL